MHHSLAVRVYVGLPSPSLFIFFNTGLLIFAYVDTAIIMNRVVLTAADESATEISVMLLRLLIMTNLFLLFF